MRHCFADITKARALLGYEPTVRLRDSAAGGGVGAAAVHDRLDGAMHSQTAPASMTTRPRVSVVVANYNGAHLLPGTDVAQAQDYDALDVVVVDNGSIDDGSTVAGRIDAASCRWARTSD